MMGSPLRAVKEDLGDEIYIADSKEACVNWCQENPQCVKRSENPG